MLTLEPGPAAVLPHAAGAAAPVPVGASVSWLGRSPSGPAQGTLHGHAAADRIGARHRPQFDIAGTAFAEPPAPAAASAPAVEVYMLGPFRVFANDRAIDGWPHGKGKAIFKYLAAHRARPVPREVLMDIFWPDAGPDAARNNLNVAIHGLRKALARADADHPFVRFAQGCYSLDPALWLWIDAEAFAGHLQRGRAAEQRGDTAAAMAEYRIAQAIHHGPLLVEDRYDSWLVPYRRRLRDGCVEVLNRLAAHAFDEGDFEACVAFAHKLLEADNCDEQAHRLLMRCYSRMGHVHLALRQYHFCVDTLARELDLIPGAPTVALSRQLRQRQAI